LKNQLTKCTLGYCVAQENFESLVVEHTSERLVFTS
jgi:hypothetical protein